MTQLTPSGLVRILGHVTLIMVIPMVGGTVIGLIADGALRTTPVMVLSGLAIGTLIASIGIWLYIRAGSRRWTRGGELGDGS